MVLPRFRLDGISLRPRCLQFSALVGIVEARKDTLLDIVRALPVRRASSEGTMWNASVLAASAIQRPSEPPPRRLSPAGRGRDLAEPGMGGPAPSATWTTRVVTYGDIDRYASLKDRTVFIGAFGGSDDILTPGGRRYGVELLAGGLQTLLRQAALSRTSPRSTPCLPVDRSWHRVACWSPARPSQADRPADSLGDGRRVLALSVAGLLVAFLPALVAAGVGLQAEGRVRRRMLGGSTGRITADTSR